MKILSPRSASDIKDLSISWLSHILYMLFFKRCYWVQDFLRWIEFNIMKNMSDQIKNYCLQSSNDESCTSWTFYWPQSHQHWRQKESGIASNQTLFWYCRKSYLYCSLLLILFWFCNDQTFPYFLIYHKEMGYIVLRIIHKANNIGFSYSPMLNTCV